MNRLDSFATTDPRRDTLPEVVGLALREVASIKGDIPACGCRTWWILDVVDAWRDAPPHIVFPTPAWIRYSQHWDRCDGC